RVEAQLARTVRIARHAQILRIPEIAAELEGMVPEGVRDVADPLELILLLVERTVARVDSQGVAELKASRAVQREGGHAGGVIVINVQARDACILGGGCAQPVRIDEDPIAEEAEAEVGQPIRTEHIIGGGCYTLIAKRGCAGEGAERRAAGQEAKS